MKKYLVCLLLVLGLASVSIDAGSVFELEKVDRQMTLSLDNPWSLLSSEQQEAVSAIYHLVGENFPLGNTYTLSKKDLRGNLKKYATAKADEDGVLKFRGLVGEILTHMVHGEFYYGEPMEHILQCDQTKEKWKTTVVPKPLISKDEDGRKMEVRLCDPSFNIYTIYLSDFQPEEDVTLLMKTSDGLASNRLTVGEKGTTQFGFTGGRVDHLESTEITLIPISTAKPIKIEFNWGLPNTGKAS